MSERVRACVSEQQKFVFVSLSSIRAGEFLCLPGPSVGSNLAQKPSSAKVRHKVGWMGGNEPRLEQKKGAQPPAAHQKAPPATAFSLFGGGGVEAKLRWDKRS